MEIVLIHKMFKLIVLFAAFCGLSMAANTKTLATVKCTRDYAANKFDSLVVVNENVLGYKYDQFLVNIFNKCYREDPKFNYISDLLGTISIDCNDLSIVESMVNMGWEIKGFNQINDKDGNEVWSWVLMRNMEDS